MTAATASPTVTPATSPLRVRPDRPVGRFVGYHRDPEATAEAFRGDWYSTGDRASRDEGGYFWFEARVDDVITSAAYRIGPFEVESALLEHPAVAEAAVVGRDDPERTLEPEPVISLHRELASAGARITAVEDFRPAEAYVTFRCWDPDGTEVEVFWEGP